MSQSPAPASIGLDLSSVRDLEESLDAAVHAGFEFAAVPLFHPRHRREGAPQRDVPATRSDLVLGSSRWTTSLVGKLSPWLQLDAEDSGLRIESERALRQELQWACHLGLPAVLAPPPPLGAPADFAAGAGSSPLPASNYAAHLAQALEASSSLHIWVRVALSVTAPAPLDEGCSEGPLDSCDGQRAETSSEICGAHAGHHPDNAPVPLASRPRGDPWEAWNAMRQHTECHPRISVALEVTADLPPAAHVARWAAEPVKAALLPTSLFLTNKAGYPTLSRGHQQLVGFLCAYRVQVCVGGVQ